MNEREKWTFLRDAPAGDAQHPWIQELSVHLLAAARSDLRRFVQLAHTVARDWVRYTTDTSRVGREDIAGFTRNPTPDDAVDALRRGWDDCDAKARLFVALCLAAGVPARMVAHWNQDALKHVSAEVNLGGKWLPVEVTLARARLGEVGDDIPLEKGTGRWLNP